MSAILLHNIRSAYNVGSIFRTADAAGVTKIFLSGYTPRPVDALGRMQKEIAKTALGAEKTIVWTYSKHPLTALDAAREEGMSVVGIEQDKRAIDYRSYKSTGSTLFVVGNEVRGMSPSLRDACDVLLEIPMHGRKESLNVSVAVGIILFACQR